MQYAENHQNIKEHTCIIGVKVTSQVNCRLRKALLSARVVSILRLCKI